MVSKSKEISSGLFIPDPDPHFLHIRIPDPGVKKAPDPGSESVTLQDFSFEAAYFFSFPTDGSTTRPKKTGE